MGNDDIMSLVEKALAFDEAINKASEAPAKKLTFKRDDNGVLWSYDEEGNRVGRIFEHGDDDTKIDRIEEV